MRTHPPCWSVGLCGERRSTVLVLRMLTRNPFRRLWSGRGELTSTARCWPALLGLLLWSALVCIGGSFASPALSARPNGGWGAAWSPGGDCLAFLSSDDGLPADAWVYDLKGKSFRRLTHGGADDLVWQSRGTGAGRGAHFLTFTTRRRGPVERWQVAVDSGLETPCRPFAHAPAGAPQGLSPDGRSLAYLLSEDKARDLHLVVAGEQKPHRLTTDFTVGSFAWSPNGDKIAFDAVNPLSHKLPQVWIYDLATKQIAHLGTAGSFDPSWSATGSLLAYSVMYSGRTSRVAIVAADGSRGALVPGILYQGEGLAWSPTAEVLAVVSRDANGQQVSLIDAAGKTVTKLSKPDLRLRFPAWSADGKQLAFEGARIGGAGFSEVWISDAEGKSWESITPRRPTCWALSPGETLLFFLSDLDGAIKVWRALTGSSGGAVAAVPNTEGATGFAATSRGDRVLLVKAREVVLLSAAGEVLSSLPLAGIVEAAWSARGDRVAAGAKGGSGEDSIRLISVAADGKLSEVASLPGSHPSWRPDGGAVAVARGNAVWRADADGANAAPLFTIAVVPGEEAAVKRLAWDPSGEAIAFKVTRSRPDAPWRQELWLARDNSPVMIYSEEAKTEFALSPENWSGLPAWTGDGRLLFSSDRGGAPQAWSVRPDGSDLRAITPTRAIWPALAKHGLCFARLDSETPLWKVSSDGSELAPLARRRRSVGPPPMWTR